MTRPAGIDEVKKKVILEVFASPSTVLPLVGGLSAWMLSWALAGNSWLNLGGLVGVLGGLGMLATRLIFGLEEITQNAYALLNEQQRSQRQAALDELDRRLSQDNDRRSEACLRQLRHLYDRFQSDVQDGRISARMQAILSTVERLFQAAVKHLEHSYHLWETARPLSGNARDSLLQERDDVIKEVELTVEHLSKSIESFHAFRAEEGESELTKLREELDETMRVARRAEERVATLGQTKSYDIAEFE